MFELWELWEGNWIHLITKDSLNLLKALQAQQEAFGYITEIRIKTLDKKQNLLYNRVEVERRTNMQLIGKRFLTPSQARELVKLGFILELINFMCREWDEYKIYVK